MKFYSCSLRKNRVRIIYIIGEVRMSMKKTIGLVCLAGAMALPQMASAYSIGSFTTGGDQIWHFNNWETKVSAIGDELYGLIQVTSINERGQFGGEGAPIFNAATDGYEIVGYFSDFIVSDVASPVIPDPADSLDFAFTGGTVRLFIDDTPDFNPTRDWLLGDASDQFLGKGTGAAGMMTGAGTGVTDGELFLELAAVNRPSGVNAGDSLAGSFLTWDPTSYTDPVGNPAIRGSGTAYYDVTDNAAALVNKVYDTNGRQYGSDMEFETEVFITNEPLLGLTTQVYGWDVSSIDPIETRAIPEPTSLALMGLGLFGFGFTARKKQNAS